MILNLVSNKNIKKVFLTKQSPIFMEKNKVDLILSPTLYWVRVFDIPIKSEKKALSVLPTLFEDILENTSLYSFQLQKIKDNKYLCFAYVESDILELIKNKGLTLSLVNNIHFAQNECISLNTFIHENEIYTYMNELLIKVPKNINLSCNLFLKEVIQDIKLSRNIINIKRYTAFLSLKNTYVLSSILFVFLCIVLTKIYIINNTISKNNLKVLEIKKLNVLPSSMIRAEAILGDYKKRITNQIKIRNFLSYLSSYQKISKDMIIDSIFYEKSVFKLIIKNVDSEGLKMYLNKNNEIIKFDLLKNSILVEVKL